MIIIGGAAFLVFLLVLLVLLLTFHRWTLDEAKTEARLTSPDSHRLVYAVPDGQDPAVLMGGLTGAGFVCVTDNLRGVVHLLVECEEKDRARVRAIIEQVDRAGIEGPAMHVRQVSFEDEPREFPGPRPA